MCVSVCENERKKHILDFFLILSAFRYPFESAMLNICIKFFFYQINHLFPHFLSFRASLSPFFLWVYHCLFQYHIFSFQFFFSVLFSSFFLSAVIRHNSKKNLFIHFHINKNENSRNTHTHNEVSK